MIRLKLNQVKYSLLRQGSFCDGVASISLIIFVSIREQFIAHESEFILGDIRQKLTLIGATKFPGFDSKTLEDFENRLFSLPVMASCIDNKH